MTDTVALGFRRPGSGPRRHILGCFATSLLATLALAIPADASAKSAALGLSGSVNSIGCPSTWQCTAISSEGQEWTFNPSSPGTPRPATVDSPPMEGTGIGEQPASLEEAIACPSMDHCTVLDSEGREVTFDPLSPGYPQPVTVDGYDTVEEAGSSSPGEEGELSFGRVPLACPSAQQCTAVDYSGHEVTFDPLSAGKPVPITVDAGARLRLLACPSSIQCTAADTRGHVVTFDPISSGTATPATISSHQLTGLACPSATICVALDEAGRVLTFDPLSPEHTLRSPLKGALPGSNAVACPSVSQCTAVGEEAYVTFDPAAPGTLVPIAVPDVAALPTVACPSVSQCTATEMVGGEETTFAPSSPSLSSPALSGVATRRAKLSFALTAGTTTALIKKITLSLPPGLTFSGSRPNMAGGVGVKADRRRLRFTASAQGGKLAIVLQAAAAFVRVNVGNPEVAVSRSLAEDVTAGRVRNLSVVVAETSADHTVTTRRLTFDLAADRPLRLGIPRPTRTKLLAIAERTAVASGDRHPYDIEAVRATHGPAERLVSGGDESEPPSKNAPVYVIAMRGHFRCGRCSHPPGTRTPSGSVITLELDAPLRKSGPSSFGLSNRYPNLRKLGIPVSLVVKPG